MRPYVLESKYQFLSLLRMPRYSVGTILFPAMFYVFFGLLIPRGSVRANQAAAIYVLATMSVFGVMAASLWGLGVGIASERGLGWIQVKRASPMPPFAYFLSKVIGAMAFGAVVVVVMFSIGFLFGHVRFEAGRVLSLAAALVSGSIPFCALGFFLGYIASPASAPALVNLVSFPMAFCSGLWVPVDILPVALQRMAPVFPTYHLAQIGFAIVGVPSRGTMASHLIALVTLTLLFSALAWLAWRRDEGKVYG